MSGEERLPDRWASVSLVEAAIAEEVEATRWDVKLPGLVDDMPMHVYLGDPVPAWSLSASGAVDLYPQPGAPAKYLHKRNNPSPPKVATEVGTAVHAKVLGTGPGWVVPVDEHGDPYELWNTNRCKAQVAEIREAGYIPLKAADAERVEAMAEQLLAHPDARTLLEETAGRPEVSAFVFDEESGVWRRCRYDYLPESDGGLLIIPDVKTAHDASDSGLSKASGEFAYHRKADWYMDVAQRLGLAERVGFAIVAQESTAPYLVNVVTLHADDLWRARALNDEAVALFARCRATDSWPGYSDHAHTITLPGYVAAREQEALNS